MFANDNYSHWLGIEISFVLQGECEVSSVVRKDMLNGFGVAHGSITFALADSALAFASNSHGKKCMSIDTQISHLKACFEGDILKARAKEISRSRSLGRYDIEVRNQKDELVAHFRGTVYIKDEDWNIED